MQPCIYCSSQARVNASLKSGHVIKNGTFDRAGDRKPIQRYFCKGCDRKCSTSTFTRTINLKKRGLLEAVRIHLVEGVSFKGTARILGIDRKTVMRRFHILAEVAKIKHLRLLDQVYRDQRSTGLWIDEMPTHLKTKLKGLSIAAAVTRERFVLGFEVVPCPPHEVYLEKSRAKFGEPVDLRARGVISILTQANRWVVPDVEIRSDKCVFYSDCVARVFPDGNHKSWYGRKARANGLGEMKVGGYDPLFAINHVFAMFRDRISRLARQTWCTTKKQQNLWKHLMIYVESHNRYVVEFLEKQNRVVSGV